LARFFFTHMFYLDILQSESSGQYYIGQTDNLYRRLAEHNDSSSKSSKTTKRFEARSPGGGCNPGGCTCSPKMSFPNSPVLRFSSRLV